MMDGYQAAIQIQSLVQSLQCGVGSGGHQLPQPAAGGLAKQSLAAATMILWADITQALPLPEQLFDHSKRDAKAPRDLVAGAVLPVAGFEDALAQIKRNRPLSGVRPH